MRKHMSNHLSVSTTFHLASMALLLGTAALPGRAAAAVPFSEAEIFFELNDTDGDLGIHASIDGEPWKELEVEGPGDTLLLLVAPTGNLSVQGMTQLFFESAEPPFDELPPAEFFARFPEGWYEISGLTLDGTEMESRDRLSHVMAAPPDEVSVNGLPLSEDCDLDPGPVVSDPVTIDWEPVTESHPEVGRSGQVTIALYQFFVELEDVKLAVDLPPTITEFQVPSAILDLASDFKFEIIARTTRGNNTAIESCFQVE